MNPLWVALLALAVAVVGSACSARAVGQAKRLTAELQERLTAEIEGRLTRSFAQRAPRESLGSFVLATELGHTYTRLVDESPALTLLGDGRITVTGPRDEGSRWDGTYDLRTVRKVRVLDRFEVSGIYANFWGAVVLYPDTPAATMPMLALDPLWLALPEVRAYLSTWVPAGIRSDLDEQWRPRRRWFSFDPRDWTLSNPRERTSAPSAWGRVEWDGDRPSVRVFGDRDRSVCVPDVELTCRMLDHDRLRLLTAAGASAR